LLVGGSAGPAGATDAPAVIPCLTKLGLPNAAPPPLLANPTLLYAPWAPKIAALPPSLPVNRRGSRFAKSDLAAAAASGL